MALVLLPCEMPWWPSVTKQLVEIETTTSGGLDHVITAMQKIHDLCNIGLDPDELDRKNDSCQNSTFTGLKDYVEKVLVKEEREHFLNKTIKIAANLARNLKTVKPAKGLSFSLQQQPNVVELEYDFVASLLANAFFSTFPNRTAKTHPTLQNFNFSFFFNGLPLSSLQRSKLKSILNYFEWISSDRSEENKEPVRLKISRKVMNAKQWLTIEDWQECTVPLCSIDIRHDLKIESSPIDTMQTIFVSPRIGGNVLHDPYCETQESVQFTTCPELLVTLLFVEALEDNESLIVENCHQIARIIGPKDRAIFERLEHPRRISFGFMDPEQYTELVVDQFEEDNFLRELNKCLLTFRQNLAFANPTDLIKDRRVRRINQAEAPPGVANGRRLSPIGESGSTTPSLQIVIKQASTATPQSQETQVRNRQSWMELNKSSSNNELCPAPNSGRKGRFIVLGSSGECLPVNRAGNFRESRSQSNDRFSSCESSDEEFHSAKGSVDEDEDGEYSKKYSNELDTPEKRFDFAQKLREALNENSSCFTESTDDDSSDEAGAISVNGSQVHDERIRVRRRGSGGFVLREDSSFDEEELGNFLVKKRSIADGDKRENDRNSSKYSFSTDFSSEFSEICENLSQDLLSAAAEKKLLDPRDKAVFHFASSILKRTLSESFVGVQFPLLANNDDNNVIQITDKTTLRDSNNNESSKDEDRSTISGAKNQNALIAHFVNARSLSVEIVKQKHRIAAQLISQILMQRRTDADYNPSQLMPVATGNWGCGSRGKGDVQLKFFIQWIGASLAGLPFLIYHTARSDKLSKLDTVCRVLRDRKWSVGRLVRMTVKCINYFLENPAQFLIEGTDDQDFFDRLLGFEKGQY